MAEGVSYTAERGYPPFHSKHEATIQVSFSLAKSVSIQVATSGRGFLFDGRTGHVFLMNKTATHILKRLCSGASVEETADEIVAQYGVSREEVVRDMADFMTELAGEGILVMA